MLVQHVRHDWFLLSKHNDIWILLKYVERSRMFTLIYLSTPNDKYNDRSPKQLCKERQFFLQFL